MSNQTEAKLDTISNALNQGRKTLSEYESKSILRAYEIPVTKEFSVEDIENLNAAIGEIGFPMVMKGCGAELSHKTERNLVRIGIRNEVEAIQVFEELSGLVSDDNGTVLIQEMVQGKREFVVGLVRDPQFGPCVMFGLGGIMTEVLKDVVFRPAPITESEAVRMIESINAKKMLGTMRGMPQVDITRLADIIVKVGQIGVDNEQVKEIDINPLIIKEDSPVAVDALVILQ